MKRARKESNQKTTTTEKTKEFQDKICLLLYDENADLTLSCIQCDLVNDKVMNNKIDFYSIDKDIKIADLFLKYAKQSKEEKWSSQKLREIFYLLGICYATKNLARDIIWDGLLKNPYIDIFNASDMIMYQTKLRQSNPTTPAQLEKKVFKKNLPYLAKFTRTIKELNGFPTIEEVANKMDISIDDANIYAFIARKRGTIEKREIDGKICLIAKQ